MAKEFIENFRRIQRSLRQPQALRSAIDLARLCMHGPVEKLNLTENTQPAILAASIAILQAS